MKNNLNLMAGLENLEQIVSNFQRINGGGCCSDISPSSRSKRNLENQCERLETASSIGINNQSNPSHADDIAQCLDITFNQTGSSLSRFKATTVKYNSAFSRAINNKRMFEIEKLLSSKDNFFDKTKNFRLKQPKSPPNKSSNWRCPDILKTKIDCLINECKPKISQFTNSSHKAFPITYSNNSLFQVKNQNSFYSPIRMMKSTKQSIYELTSQNQLGAWKNLYDKYGSHDPISKFKDEFNIERSATQLAWAKRGEWS